VHATDNVAVLLKAHRFALSGSGNVVTGCAGFSLFNWPNFPQFPERHSNTFPPVSAAKLILKRSFFHNEHMSLRILAPSLKHDELACAAYQPARPPEL
jgi:hypothetical protein